MLLVYLCTVYKCNTFIRAQSIGRVMIMINVKMALTMELQLA